MSLQNCDGSHLSDGIVGIVIGIVGIVIGILGMMRIVGMMELYRSFAEAATFGKSVARCCKFFDEFQFVDNILQEFIRFRMS